MITLGAVYRGPELEGSAANKAIGDVMRAAAKLRGDFQFGSAPAVNVVFFVPGSLGGPDWEGIRDGTFSRKQKMLMIQVAVPSRVLGTAELSDFVIQSLHTANALASEIFQKKKMAFPLAEAEKLVDAIQCEVS